MGIAGLPVARLLMDGETVEVTRVCVLEDTPMACSMIYGSLCRAAKALGWKRVVTYTLQSEPGTSPRAAGFVLDGQSSGRPWDTPKRKRDRLYADLFGEKPKYQPGKKNRWVRHLTQPKENQDATA